MRFETRVSDRGQFQGRWVTDVEYGIDEQENEDTFLRYVKEKQAQNPDHWQYTIDDTFHFITVGRLLTEAELIDMSDGCAVERGSLHHLNINEKFL